MRLTTAPASSVAPCFDAQTGSLDPTQAPSRKGVPDSPCNFNNFTFSKCIWYPLASTIGSVFFWLGFKAATLGASVFEAALQFLIVEFGRYLAFIKPGIDKGWEVLRDIANIVIIGLFVFIAINIILGVKEFGDKKKVARVLIIAVLINFSLLFTKVIVDASNFTAYHFYNAMTRGAQTQEVSIPGYGQVASSVVAGKFLQFLGVQGFADAKQKLEKVANNEESGLLAILYGLLSFVLLLGVAFVFLYGAFLIVARAILIIFLMLTSAVAFATWLMPQQYITGGFRKWWESLLQTAFFAPILVALLWVTIVVADHITKALAGPRGEGTLGKLADSAADTSNLVALLNFGLVIGLLFAAFATSRAFATSISGFKYAATFPALGLAGISRAGGWVGRKTIGGLGKAGGESLAARATANYVEGNYFRAGMQWLGSRGLSALGRRDFNLMKTPLGTEVSKLTALKAETLAGKKIGGYEEMEKKRIDRLAEAGEKMSRAAADRLTDDERRNAVLAGDPELNRRFTAAQAGHAQAQNDERTARTRRDTLEQELRRATQERDTLHSNVQQMQQDRDTMRREMEQELDRLQQERANLSQVGTPEAQRRLREVEEAIVNAATRRTAIDEQDNRIRQTQQRLSDVEQHHANITAQRNEADRDLTTATQQLETAANELRVANAAVANAVQERFGAAELGARKAYYRVTNLPWVAAGQRMEDDRLARRVRERVTGRAAGRRWRDAFGQEIRDEVRAAQPPPQPPPPPAAG